MTSAATFVRYGLLAVFITMSTVGIQDAISQTTAVQETEAGDDEGQPVDRGKMRLQLLLSLVKNELKAASLKKDRLVSEQVGLRRERAELSAAGDQQRPADRVRLEQIENRLGTIEQELAEVEQRLPEISGERDSLQRRLDEANGIQRDEEAAEVADNQENGVANSGKSRASIWLDGKRRVQEALVYLGGYNALIDGDFGPRTRQAVQLYQRRNALDETGVLTKEQEEALLSEAQDQRDLYGVETFQDETIGYRFSYPALLLSETEEVSDRERRMATTDGQSELVVNVLDNDDNLETLYREAIASYDVQYRRKRGSWFVVAGLMEEGRIIYDTIQSADGKMVRARLSYPADQRELWSPFAVILFNTFSLQPAG